MVYIIRALLDNGPHTLPGEVFNTFYEAVSKAVYLTDGYQYGTRVLDTYVEVFITNNCLPDIIVCPRNMSARKLKSILRR